MEQMGFYCSESGAWMCELLAVLGPLASFFYNTLLSKQLAGPVLGAIVRPLRPLTSLDIVL